MAKMDLEKKLCKIWRTVTEGGSIIISSWMSLVGWVLWQFEGNQTPACKSHFMRVRLRLVWVAKMDLEKKHSTIWRTVIEANQTPPRKYHFLSTGLRLVWVAEMDLEKKLSTIWRTVIEGGSMTISSWKSMVGWVLWQIEENLLQHVNTISWG